MNPLHALLPPGQTGLATPRKPAGDKTVDFSGTDFSDRLKQAVKEVNTLQNTSDTASEMVIKGELGIHEGMMALQEADMAMRLLVQVRSKSLEAFKEIMHMQF